MDAKELTPTELGSKLQELLLECLPALTPAHVEVLERVVHLIAAHFSAHPTTPLEIRTEVEKLGHPGVVRAFCVTSHHVFYLPFSNSTRYLVTRHGISELNTSNNIPMQAPPNQ